MRHRGWSEKGAAGSERNAQDVTAPRGKFKMLASTDENILFSRPGAIDRRGFGARSGCFRQVPIASVRGFKQVATLTPAVRM